jgi:molecular chaperone HscB
VICWSCEKEGGGGPFCAACKAILPPDAGPLGAGPGIDRFAVLGLPRKFEVDLGAAEAAYKELSRQLHPDRFAKADPRARKAALGRTVEINDAWRTVKDPVRRAEYLLELAGYALGAGEKSAEMSKTRKVSAPPTFLVEIMELREELAAAQKEGDAVKLAFMSEDMRGRAAAAMKTIGTSIDGGTPESLDEAARALMSLRYYQRFLDEVTAHEERSALSGGDRG